VSIHNISVVRETRVKPEGKTFAPPEVPRSGTWLGVLILVSYWKKVVLCASLFASVSIALARASRFMEPAVLPVIAAIGLGLIGVVLILVSPGARSEKFEPGFGNSNGRSKL
jgi:hypothetical protein